MNDGTITLDLLVKPEPGTAAALTLRQHYAGLALNALVARAPVMSGDADHMARLAVDLADALVARLGQ